MQIVIYKECNKLLCTNVNSTIGNMLWCKSEALHQFSLNACNTYYTLKISHSVYLGMSQLFLLLCKQWDHRGCTCKRTHRSQVDLDQEFCRY